MKTTEKIGKEIETLKDDDNHGQHENFEKKHFTIGNKDDQYNMKFKKLYIKRIGKPFGRLQSRRAKKYGAEVEPKKPALHLIKEE